MRAPFPPNHVVSNLVVVLNLVDEKGFEPAASSLRARKNLS